jgi:uncharacterized membrane protein
MFPGANSQAEAAVYRHGMIRKLGTLGGSASYGTGVNDRDEIVGYSYLSGDTAFHATLCNTHKKPVDLGTLRGSTSEALAVNDRGITVGAAELLGDHETHAARFGLQHGAVDLGSLGGSVSTAQGMND